MTAARERKLRTTQRRMLRLIVQVARQVVRPEHAEEATTTDSEEDVEEDDNQDNETEMGLEPWHEWIRRSTYIAEDLAISFKVVDWVSEQRERKWNLAGHTARRTDRR
eukprot:11425064-Karenia_brevis.AAC.1